MITDIKDVTPANLEKELRTIAERLELKDYREALKFPRFFQVETTRVCNAKCTFCAIDQWDKKTPFMSDALFEKVAVELGEYKDWILMVNANRAGDPLMDKKIVKRVARLTELGLKNVSISTNAELLTPEKTKGLIEAGLNELWISIDSVNKETYEQQRVGLHYDTVMKNVKEMFKIRDALNPKMVVRVRGVCLFDLTADEGKAELKAWEQFWGNYKGKQDRIYMKRPHTWGNQIDLDKRVHLSANNGDIFHPCILPWSTMHITAMGTVPLCPMDYDAIENLGDINKQSIAEVWKGPGWQRIRELHSTGNRNEISFCRGCKLFDLDFKLEKKDEALQLYQ